MNVVRCRVKFFSSLQGVRDSVVEIDEVNLPVGFVNYLLAIGSLLRRPDVQELAKSGRLDMVIWTKEAAPVWRLGPGEIVTGSFFRGITE